MPAKHGRRYFLDLSPPNLDTTIVPLRQKPHGNMSQHSGKSSPSKLKLIPAYFSQAEKKDGRAQKANGGSKMAEATGGMWAESEALTKADLMAVTKKIESLETELLTKLADLLKPMADQLGQLNSTIQNVSKIAEGAMDLCLAQREEIKGLQQEHETQAEKLAILSNRQRFFNLKFKGIGEKAEENHDLVSYMANWLAGIINTEDQCAPAISQAYRVGAPNNPKRQKPRDVVVTFYDARVKNIILAIVRGKGFLPHQTGRIQVYADLAPEALSKKKELKEILTALQEAKI